VSRARYLAALSLVACGDNIHPVAPPLEHADTLFFAAHPDDDMIFMQPEVLHALATGSVTTVYATTASPSGVDRHLYESTLVAYGMATGSSDWECGSLSLGTRVVDHCRLRDRPVSLVNLDLADGGVPGTRRDSLLHLVDGTVTAIPLDGPDTAMVTLPDAVDLFGDVIVASSPDELHTLELAGTHGHDHSSHMFVASFVLWAAARLGYTGPVTWHRGYNVADEPPTLAGADLDAARAMLGSYEACASGRDRCGAEVVDLLPIHATWIARQYALHRIPEATGALSLDGQCLDASLGLGDCASAARVQLAAGGALTIGNSCVASTPSGGLALEACTSDPQQYWVLDDEGFVWNGAPPSPSADMAFDHVRCLADGGVPTCGEHLQPRWQLVGP